MSRRFAPNAFKVTALFPIYGNDTGPFPVAVWDWWRDQLTLLSPGYTEFGVRGYWEGYTDEHRCVYWVVKTLQQVDAIRRFVRQARDKFGQEAMYFEVQPVYHESVR